MAGFVIHDLAGRVLLQELEKKNFCLSSKDKNNFLLGNLIVDSSKLPKVNLTEDSPLEEIDSVISKFGILVNGNESKDEKLKLIKYKYQDMVQEEKVSTHFRDKSKVDYNIQLPNPDLFAKKYVEILSNGNLSALGYLFHLYTDDRFFGSLFPISFTSLDNDLKPTELIKDTKKIYIIKSDIVCDVRDFYSLNTNVSIYDDYTTMNKILLNYFKFTFDEEEIIKATEDFVNPGINEVDYGKIDTIIRKMKSFIDESMAISSVKLNVFDEKQVIDFIINVVDMFIIKYGALIGSCLIKNNNIEDFSKKKIYRK